MSNPKYCSVPSAYNPFLSTSYQTTIATVCSTTTPQSTLSMFCSYPNETTSVDATCPETVVASLSKLSSINKWLEH